MRAVIGTVTSSKRTSLSKASSVLSHFAEGDAGAGREVNAYLRRASAAFVDLVDFHRQLRADLAGEEEAAEMKTPARVIEASEKKKRKKKREKVVENGDGGVGEEREKKRKHLSMEEAGVEDGNEPRERKKKRRKNEN